MKKLSNSKKLFALILSVLIIFSSISVAAVENEVEIIDDHEHIYTNYVVVDGEEPTCIKPGKAIGKCVVASCNKTSTKTLPAEINNHNAVEVIEKTEPTCIFDGYEVRKCSDCKKTYKVIIEKTGHSFNESDWNVTQEPVHYYNGTVPEIRQGVRIKTCSKCDAVVTETFYAPHVFAENDNGSVDTYATCSSGGTVFKSCLICKSAVSVDLPVDPDAHKFSEEVHIIDSNFSCKQDGIGVVVCEYCDAVEERIVSKEKAHDYLKWTVVQKLPANATCSNRETVYGVRKKICSICDYVDQAEPIYADHNLTNIVGVEPTCTTDGYDRGYCRTCNTPNAVNVIPADSTKHRWLDPVVTKEPTCQSEGTKLMRCALNPTHIEEEKIAKLDHVYLTDWEVSKEATCCEDGFKTNFCVTCNQTISEIIPKVPGEHNLDKSTVVKKVEAQCYVEGYIEYRCIDCLKNIKIVLEKHSQARFVTESVEPTCSMDGYIKYECEGCTNTFTEILPKSEEYHKLDVKTTDPLTYHEKEIVKPTCCTTGLNARACTICLKDVEYVTVPATGAHNVTNWISTGSECNSIGKKTRYCTNTDGKGNTCTFQESENIRITHNYSAWVYTDDDGINTCINPATRTRICLSSGCRHEETELYYQKHTAGTFAFKKAGTDCSTGGDVNITCAVCNNVYDVITVEKGAHVIDYDLPLETVGRNEFFCTAKVFECKICKDEDTNEPFKVTVKKEHRFRTIIEAVDPTCEAPGNTAEKQCLDCQYYIKSVPLGTLPHNFNWGEGGSKICDACGVYETDIEDENGQLVICDHFCHNNGTIAKVLMKVLTFFWKTFRTNQVCKCGTPHYVIENKIIL